MAWNPDLPRLSDAGKDGQKEKDAGSRPQVHRNIVQDTG